MKRNLVYYILLPLLLSVSIAALLNVVISRYFLRQAKEEIGNILLSNRGFHQYIQKVLHPTIFRSMEQGLIRPDFYAPQAMSSTYIVRTMHGLYNEERQKQGLKPVYYKLAANNPRNPVNKADNWEARMIKLFNDDPSLKEHEETVTVEGKKYLYYAVPFLRNDGRCMRCHGDPKDAPPGLLRKYPGPGGFYEKVGEVRAIESMRMPIVQEGRMAMILAGSAGSGVFAILALFLFNTGLRNRVRERTKDLETEIDERRKAEAHARKSEEDFRTLFNKAADPIFLVRPDGTIADVNDMVCERYNYRRDELIGMNVAEIDSPATRNLAPERTAKVVQDGLVVFEAEHITKDGRILPVEANACSIMLDGRPVLISTCRDITERKRAEEAIAGEKERLAVTLRSIGDGVLVTDIGGAITLINKVGEAMTGWTTEEAEGRPLEEVFHIVHESTRERCESPVEKALRTGAIVGLENHTVLIRKDGEEVVIADSAAPIRDRHSQIIGIVLVFRDVTAQTRMEQEMQKMQKLESLGLLAGGLAHDFNNLLTSIMGNVSLVQMGLNESDPSQAHLREAENAASRATDLTRQLLTFAKGGAPIKKRADLADIARETCTFATSGSNTTCRYTVPADLWSAEVDKGQIGQVFNNLVINAIHAMPNGGRIDIGLENRTVAEEDPVPLPPGDYVRITVKDEGTGIAEAVLPRIFDPYFTTKPSGSGLGLATVLSIVNRHDGHVSVQSRPGAGTTFTIHLPATRAAVAEEQEGVAGVAKGRGRVLVMDDEILVRKVAGEILKALGYAVEFATDGQEAVETYERARKEQRPFNVVIMDLTIPGGMGGKETMRRLQTIDADARVIVSSGYSMDPIMAEYRSYGFCGVVCKPYSARDIGDAIARAMAG